jgi:2'-5' RNA ligase
MNEWVMYPYMLEEAGFRESAVQLDIHDSNIDRARDAIYRRINYKDREGPMGRAHVTIAYGVHPEANEQHVKDLVKEHDLKKGPIKLGKLRVFTGTKFDVLAMEVHGEHLHKMHKAMNRIQMREQRNIFTPHVTIAKVKAGTGAKYANLPHPEEGIEHPVEHLTLSKHTGEKVKVPLRF